jgi:hypothetical protein
MARKTKQDVQHAAARRELEAKGFSNTEINKLERDWDNHTARSLDPADPYPAGI